MLEVRRWLLWGGWPIVEAAEVRFSSRSGQVAEVLGDRALEGKEACVVGTLL